MKKIIGAVAAVLVAGAAVFAAVGFGGGDEDTATANELPPSTAQVTKQTLVDAETASGELGYGAQTTLNARLSGTVTWIAATDRIIKRGETLYKIDDKRVVLLYGKLPAYRDLHDGVTGNDVEQFEKNLAELGYDGFTVDDDFTSSTADAVREWQDDMGLPETGRVEPGRVAYTASTVRVDSHSVVTGDLVQPGKAVMNVTGTARVVTVRLDVDDQRLAKNGAAVRLTVPGGERIGGKITAISTVIESGAAASGGNTAETEATTKIEVTVSVDKPAALAEFDQASVDVDFTASERKNVLTVPVAALLALAEGGYGVEVINGSTTDIIAVQTGLFADGRVEITGQGITEGLTVGMPS